MNVRPPIVILKGARGRKKFLDDYPLEAGEFLVEVSDRQLEKRSYFVVPMCEDATIVAKMPTIVRKALFAEGCEVRFKTIYKVRKLRGLERCVMLETGEVIDTRVLSLFVVKRGAVA